MAEGIVIYHNPECGTSRNVLTRLRDAGHEPRVVEYLCDGWNRELLERLMRETGLSPRELLRTAGTPAEELGLLAPETDDGTILEAMLRDPILVNRPIVVTPVGTMLCRPSERVNLLLAKLPAQGSVGEG